jgi:type I restriction enzyme S subunit
VKAGRETKRLGEIIQLEYGKPLADSDRNPNGLYPAYGANGIKDRTDKFYKAVPSIIVGRKGSAGEVTLTEEKYWPLDVTFFVEFDRAKYELQYLYFLLLTLNLPSMAKGVKPGINRNDVYDITVITTDIEEQRRIVTLLDVAFADIATAKANAEKNLQNARELFASHLKSLFVRRSEGWKEKTLAEISTTFGRGKSRHRPRNDPALYGGQYPFVQTGDVRNAEHIITEFSQTYSEAGLAQSKLWPKGTICITIAANIAETGILGFDACFPDSVIGVVPDPREAEVGYVEYVLQSFKVKLQALGQGSAQANINMGTFEKERFPFPSGIEQRRIVDKLDTLSEESQRLQSIYRQKLTALDDLKKSLLHQAFSGHL